MLDEPLLLLDRAALPLDRDEAPPKALLPPDEGETLRFPTRSPPPDPPRLPPRSMVPALGDPPPRLPAPRSVVPAWLRFPC